MTERTTVRLPGELLIRAKRKAAAEGRTVTSLVMEGLRLVLASDKRGSKKERVVPRISAARGGLMPGVDLTDLAALQEMDDLAAIQRLKRGK